MGSLLRIAGRHNTWWTTWQPCWWVERRIRGGTGTLTRLVCFGLLLLLLLRLYLLDLGFQPTYLFLLFPQLLRCPLFVLVP